jgi:hypothetical protein
MARRHVHAHPILIPSRNVHKQVSQPAMVLAHDVIWLHVLAELNQIIHARLSRAATLQDVRYSFDFRLFFWLIRVKVVQHQPDFCFREVVSPYGGRLSH